MILSRHVESFIAVAEYKSLKAAADHLYISTSALSQQMKLLEQDVGVPLFRTSYKGLILTPSGEVFLEKMRQLKALEEEAKRLAIQASEVSLPTLSIAYTHNIEREELFPLYRLLKQNYHQELELFAVPYENAIQNTLKGKYDACFVPNGERLAKCGLQTMVFRVEKPFLTMPQNHPLAAKKWIARRDLDGLELVLPERGLFQNIDAIYAELQQFDIHPIIIEVTDVLQSDMYCRIHGAVRFCRSKALSPEMVVIPFETDAVSEICLAFPSGQDSFAKLRNLFSVIREEKAQIGEVGCSLSNVG